MTEEITSAFWDWAVEVYMVDAVRTRLLAWQDDYDVVILELLYVLWLARQGRTMGDSDMRALHLRIRPWVDQVVLPLRQVRQQWTADIVHSDYRSRLLTLELEAERHLAALLQSLPIPGEEEATETCAVTTQIDLWCAVLNKPISAAEKRALLSDLM